MKCLVTILIKACRSKCCVHLCLLCRMNFVLESSSWKPEGLIFTYRKGPFCGADTIIGLMQHSWCHIFRVFTIVETELTICLEYCLDHTLCYVYSKNKNENNMHCGISNGIQSNKCRPEWVNKKNILCTIIHCKLVDYC